MTDRSYQRSLYADEIGVCQRARQTREGWLSMLDQDAETVSALQQACTRDEIDALAGELEEAARRLYRCSSQAREAAEAEVQDAAEWLDEPAWWRRLADRAEAIDAEMDRE